MWKLIKLHVDNLNANSYLQCALTDYVGLVLFYRRVSYCFMKSSFLFILAIAIVCALLVPNL